MKGEKWKIMRKFFSQQIKERCLCAINSMSLHTNDTVNELLISLKKASDQPIDISSYLLITVNNFVRLTFFGEDGMTKEEINEYNEGYNHVIATLTTKSVLSCGVLTNYWLIPFGKGMNSAKQGYNKMKSVLYTAIKRRKLTFDETIIRDTFDAFFKERMERISKKDSTSKYFTDDCLLFCFYGILFDALVFTALFIGEFIKALVEHPREQDKIYQELLDVLGSERNPTIEDRKNVTYTNAFILEVMRTTDIFPIFTSLECDEETTISDYKIPKGSILFYNFCMAHMNQKDFEEPEKFNPSRYITKDGQKRPELPILFGIGKHSCLGKEFVMSQVFLCITSIVKNFHLTKPVDENSIVNSENKIFVCAHPRNQF